MPHPNHFSSRTAHRALWLPGIAMLAALAGCHPEPPPTDQPPEPKAQAHTELRDAIQAPQNKARAVEQVLQDGQKQQQAQIDAAEGG